MDWEFLGKISIVLSVLGAVWAITRHIAQARLKKSRLIAYVAAERFRLPPCAKDERAQITKEVSEVIDRFLFVHRKKNEAEPDEAFEHAASLARSILSELEADRTLRSELYLKGCWFASVINRGDEPLDDVAILFPDTSEVEICHRRAEERWEDVFAREDNIPIGRLEPKGSCEVVAWTYRKIADEAFPQVRLSHASGEGVVRPVFETTGWIRYFGEAVARFIFGKNVQ